MSEQQAIYSINTVNQCKTANTTIIAEPAGILSFGHFTIRLEHPDFQEGYEEGQAQYQQWHQEDTMIDTTILLFLTRNGWGSGTYSETWQTGYIVGWLFALFAQSTGQQR